MTDKIKYIIAILLLIFMYAYGRYMQPAKVEIKTVEKVIIKEVVKKDEVVVTHHITKPDGSTETTTTTSTHTQTNTQQSSENTHSNVVVNKKTDYRLGVLAGIDNNNYTKVIYGLSGELRVFGPISAGVWVFPSETMGGVSVSIEF